MSRLGSGAVSQQPVRRQGCLIFARGHCPEEMCRPELERAKCGVSNSRPFDTRTAELRQDIS